MKNIFLFTLILFSLNATSNSKQSEITISSELSKNFHLLISQIEQTKQIHHVIDDLIKINKNFGLIAKIEVINNLIDLELKKLILSSKFDRYTFKSTISVKDVLMAKEKLKEIKGNLSHFAFEVLSMAIDDFTPLIKNKKLELYNKSKKTKLISRRDKTLIQKIHKYSAPWLISLLKKSTSQIEEQFSQLGIQFLKNLSAQLDIIKHHYSEKPSHKTNNLISGLEGFKKKKLKSQAPKGITHQDEPNPLELLKDIPNKSRGESINDLFKELPSAQ